MHGNHCLVFLVEGLLFGFFEVFTHSQQYQRHHANAAEELKRSFVSSLREKSMNVSEVKVTDEDGYLACSKTIRANNKIVNERTL